MLVLESLKDGMRAENEWEGRVREAVYIKHAYCWTRQKPCPKLGLCHSTSLAKNVNRHPHPRKSTDHADMFFLAMYNPTPTRNSLTLNFSPSYMDHAESLALGELGDPLYTSLNLFLENALVA